MREIKFRIWLSDENRMLYNPYIQGRDEINDFFNGKNNKYIWMQYTGIKDKNGVEIYEADILLIENEELAEIIGEYGRYETNNIISPVFFENGCFNIRSEEEKENFEYMLACYDKSEIIGNIYENEELL